ncbi:lycopene cyclase family protein [Leeuwenhoekiella palythoae]|uniref:Lycopene beta-cyclase n=1 Tax=Leeuwenhoekiella palythoae TaxID=573501 RepID=A0A1M5VMM7_9FLAO|nr:lycopene cyclase family protein [Leeuwenhoekiella palythoae]RXG30974.1 lycopene beta-cyclase [Leeuwenhoekiella palythoae]SHH76450.1 lycopene beta-cyclase [Leeuwenhoekiella palythoae]
MQDATNHFDYIILGAGLSGLMLAYRMSQDAFFKDKSVLILDKSDKKINDRTWCFWSQHTAEWDTVISKKWNTIRFKSAGFDAEIPLKKYTYSKIEGLDFYNQIFEQLQASKNFQFRTETYLSHREHNVSVEVQTKNNTYSAAKLFTSILPPERLEKQTQFPVLQQHFIGWEVKTPSSVFEPEIATFMDFDIPQRRNTRFMYVLPTEKNKALVEYTLFSEKLLPKAEYEVAIKEYLEELGVPEYTIHATEQGSIPMTAFPFEQFNSKNILHIGTAGGWTRGSTGYTFTYTTKRTKQLIAFLRTESDLSKFSIKDRYRWYDAIFLDVLYRKNQMGAQLFTRMFKKNNVDAIFRFLDGESSLKDDLSIILSMPKKEFIKSFFGLK